MQEPESGDKNTESSDLLAVAQTATSQSTMAHTTTSQTTMAQPTVARQGGPHDVSLLLSML